MREWAIAEKMRVSADKNGEKKRENEIEAFEGIKNEKKGGLTLVSINRGCLSDYLYNILTSCKESWLFKLSKHTKSHQLTFQQSKTPSMKILNQRQKHRPNIGQMYFKYAILPYILCLYNLLTIRRLKTKVRQFV